MRINSYTRYALRKAGIFALYGLPFEAFMSMLLLHLGGMRLSWWVITSPLWVYVPFAIAILWGLSLVWAWEAFFKSLTNPRYPRRYRRQR